MSARRIVSLVGPPGCGKSDVVETLTRMAYGMSRSRDDLRLKIISPGALIASELRRDRRFRLQYEQQFDSKELLPDKPINWLVSKAMNNGGHYDILFFVGFPMTKAQFKWARQRHLVGLNSFFVIMNGSINDHITRLRDRGEYSHRSNFALRQDYIENLLRVLAIKASRHHSRVILDRALNGSTNAFVADILSMVQSA